MSNQIISDPNCMLCVQQGSIPFRVCTHKQSARKEMRTSAPEWTGMSAQHRQSNLKKPYRTKGKLLVIDMIKAIAIVVILVVIGNELYNLRQACIRKYGNDIICMD